MISEDQGKCKYFLRRWASTFKLIAERTDKSVIHKLYNVFVSLNGF